jgi:sensor histidine kinase YesM
LMDYIEKINKFIGNTMVVIFGIFLVVCLISVIYLIVRYVFLPFLLIVFAVYLVIQGLRAMDGDFDD